MYRICCWETFVAHKVKVPFYEMGSFEGKKNPLLFTTDHFENDLLELATDKPPGYFVVNITDLKMFLTFLLLPNLHPTHQRTPAKI